MIRRLGASRAGKTFILAIAAILVIGTLTTGCAKTGTSNKGERMLRFTAANMPKMDPAIGSDDAAGTMHVNLYDSLVFPKNDGSVEPSIATKWETSPDGLVWTFYLRQGVKFHSGKELTAQDVAFSMQRLLTVGQGWAYLFKGRVDKAEAIDKTTVRFTLKKPFGPFLSTLVRLYILSKDDVMAHIQKPGNYGDNGDYGTQWLLTDDAGSGPYKVKEFKQGESVLAEQFKGYWNGFKPNSPTSIKLIGTTEAVTVRTLMSRHELEISDTFQSIEALKALGQIPGVEVLQYPSSGITDLTLNTKKPPTDDVNFRKAVAYAVDYDTLVKDIFPGNPKAVGLVPSALAGHNSKVNTPTYDPDKAKEYLSKSKYANQLDKYPLELAWVAEVPDREKIALLIQASLAKIGVKVNVVRMPWASLVDKAARPDTTPNAAIVSESPDYPEAGAHLDSRWHSRGAGTWLQMDWVKDPDLDKAIEDALSTSNWDQRMVKYQAIQEKLMDLQPSVGLMQGLTRRAYQAAYIKWPAAEAAKAKQPVTSLYGYVLYARDIEILTDKVPK